MKTLLHIGLFLCLSFLSQAQITTPVIKAGFGVDADLRANHFNGFTQFNDDWFRDGTPGLGQQVIDTTGAASMVSRYLVDPAFRKLPFFRTMSVPQFSIINNRLWIDAVYIRDYNGQAGGDSTAFVMSNKNGDSPADWTGGVTSVLNKNDIGEMMIHVKRAGSLKNDSLWFMGGISLQGTTGSRYFDFELYQTDIFYSRSTGQFSNYGPDAGHTSWKFDAAGNITAPGDVIFTAEYSSSSLSAVEARIWVDRAALSIVPAAFDWVGNFDGASTSSKFGYANIRPKTTGDYYTGLQSGNNTWAGPYGFIDGGNNFLTTYTSRQFMEFSVNLSKLGLDPITLLGGSACGLPFRRILVKTRSSVSFSAELKDFIGPFDFFVTAPVEAQPDVTFFCGNLGISNINVLNPLPASVYNWTTLDGHIVGDSTGTGIVVDTPGTYIVSQKLLDGCSTSSADTVTITFDPDCWPLADGNTQLSGDLKENTALLKWTTTNNDLVDFFEIQKSGNGETFISEASIAATSADRHTMNYASRDEVANLRAGDIFYRLKITYKTGKTGYSNVVRLKKEQAMRLYPNPADRYIQIEFPLAKKGNLNITAYDLSGRAIYNRRHMAQQGTNFFVLEEVQQWRPGIYMIRLQSEQGETWKKIVVMHGKSGRNYINQGPF